MITETSTDILLRKKFAAKKLGASTRALDKWVKTKPNFPQPIKIGDSRQSAVYFSEKALDEYIASLNNKGAN